MDKPEVLEHRVRGGAVEVKFQDDSVLILIPYRNWGNIEGFDSALLYQEGVLEAFATDRPSRYSKPEESGFWSREKITQQELAMYWTAANQVGRDLYTRYDQGEISEDTWMRQGWRFCRINIEGWMTRDALEKGEERVFEENPGRFDEKYL